MHTINIPDNPLPPYPSALSSRFRQEEFHLSGVMATISALPPILRCRIRRPSSSSPHPFSSNPSSLSCSSPSPSFPSACFRVPSRRAMRVSRAVAEEETLVPGESEEESPNSEQQPVSVPVSPSDMLTMFFKADGTMDESAIPAVSSALEAVEGVSDLKVQIAEGIASVELVKQTTVQATGVASNLVEIIQGSGFRLQQLNLSFEDEEDLAN
ncbi:putative heavy metal-associated domain, HMA, heavy metal-associated domain superfamily [Dioscorea sansibarensis]